MIKILSSVYILFFVLGCTVQNEKEREKINNLDNLVSLTLDTEPRTTINLTREISFGGMESLSANWIAGMDGAGWFAGIEIDDAGRVYIGEYSALTVHVFDFDGSYLKSVGQRGSGPGEFQGISDIKMIDDFLYVFDPLQFRMNIYSLDSLKLYQEKNIHLDGDPVNLHEYEELSGWHVTHSLIISDNLFLAGYMEHSRDARIGSPTYNVDQNNPIRYHFVNSEGKILSEKIFELNDENLVVADVDGSHLVNLSPLPFLSRSIVSVSEENYLYTAWTEDFLIKAYDPDGNYLRAIYLPMKKASLNRDEILERFKGLGEWNEALLSHAELPENWPALDNLLIDDENRLWISTNVESLDIFEWWVINGKTGELLTRFEWPRNKPIEIIKNGHVYTRETDEETGLQQVVRYGIEFK